MTRLLVRRGLAIVLMLMTWESLYRVGWLNPFYLPPPSTVGAVLVSLFADGAIWTHLAATCTAAFAGLMGGLIIGVILGFAAALSPLVADLLEPVMILLNAIPRVILAPLFVIWLGIGLASKVALALVLVAVLIFFAVYNGAGNFKSDRLLEDWGNPYDLEDPGIAFKRHPCCGSTHPAVDAMLHLRETHKLTPERVTKVESWTHPRRLAHTNRSNPQSGLDGKFSIQYVLARALMHGIVSMDHFSDDAVRDPATRALMARVTSAPDPEAKRETTDHFYCRLKLTKADGEAVEHFQDRPIGRDKDHPLPAGALEAKFRDCAQVVLDAQATETLLQQCLALETLPDVSIVLDVIAAGVKPPAAAARSRAYA